MSMQDSYLLSPEDCRRQRVRIIDTLENAALEQLRALQCERAIILQTLGVTALPPTLVMVEEIMPPVSETG